MIIEYLKRIGISENIRVDTKSLRLIQKQHLLSVPFENLNMHIHKQVNTDIEFLFDKIVKNHRGGICYELNYLLYMILVKLNFNPTLIGAKVILENGSFFDHVLIKVEIKNSYYLTDVGFGDNFLYPLEFKENVEQKDSKGTWVIKKNKDETYSVLKKENEDYNVSYILKDEEQSIEKFRERMNYFTHSEDSIFKKNLFCSLEYENGRASLKHDKLIVTVNRQRTETKINSLNEYLFHLKLHFHIELNEDEINTINTSFFLTKA